MKSISMNGMTALDEVQRRLLIMTDELSETDKPKLKEVLEYLEKVRKQVLDFKTKAQAKAEAKSDERFVQYCQKHSVDSTNEKIKAMFSDYNQDSDIYIKELEGYLSGDPNLSANENEVQYWYHNVSRINDELRKKIKYLEDRLDKEGT